MSNFSLSESIDHFWRYALAHSFTFMFFVLSLVSFSSPQTVHIKPFFVIVIVYFWAIYRPALVPPLLLLVLGGLYDILSGQTYIGMSAIFLIGVHFLIQNQRLYLMAQSFWVTWLGFVLIYIAILAVEWILYSLFAFQIQPIWPSLIKAAFGVLAFPVMALFLSLINKILPANGKTLSHIE